MRCVSIVCYSAKTMNHDFDLIFLYYFIHECVCPLSMSVKCCRCALAVSYFRVYVHRSAWNGLLTDVARVVVLS